jgi:hypothetical protein
MSHISSILAFSLSPLCPTASSSRNCSRLEETSLKKSCCSESCVGLSLDSRSRSSFLATSLTSLFLPFLHALQESRACSTVSVCAGHQGHLLSSIAFIFFRCLPTHACVDLSCRYLEVRDLFPFRILGSRVASFLLPLICP